MKKLLTSLFLIISIGVFAQTNSNVKIKLSDIKVNAKKAIPVNHSNKAARDLAKSRFTKVLVKRDSARSARMDKQIALLQKQKGAMKSQKVSIKK